MPTILNNLKIKELKRNLDFSFGFVFMVKTENETNEDIFFYLSFCFWKFLVWVVSVLNVDRPAMWRPLAPLSAFGLRFVKPVA